MNTRRLKLNQRSLVLTAAALVWLAELTISNAIAGPFFFAATRQTAGTIEQQIQSGTGPVSIEHSADMGFGYEDSWEQLAAAGPGNLRAFSQRVGNVPLNRWASLTPVTVSSEAGFLLDDILITPNPVLGGNIISTVPASGNLIIGGTFDVQAHATEGLAPAGALAQVRIDGDLFLGTSHNRFSGSAGASATSNDPLSPRFTTAGILDGLSTERGVLGHVPISTPSFDLPVNTPFSFFLSLTASAEVGGGTDQTFASSVAAVARSDFAHTLSFPTSGPVFNLPDGFTVNSESGLIVNNRWVGAQAVVPEPSSLALLSAGALGLLGYGRRRRRGNAAQGINVRQEPVLHEGGSVEQEGK